MRLLSVSMEAPMKAAFIALALLASPSVWASQITIFLNYNPNNSHYTDKHFSTEDAPLSAGELLKPKVGLCYKGEPSEALALLHRMVEEYNLNAPRANSPTPMEIVDANTRTDDELKAEVLSMKLTVPNARGALLSYEWKRIRRCIR